MASMIDRAATPAARIPATMLGSAAAMLVAVSWISAALFGTYILAFYGGAALGGDIARWNETLPRLHETRTPAANLAIGAHFVTGGILLLLGPIQLIGAIRRRVPALHRWLGRSMSCPRWSPDSAGSASSSPRARWAGCR